MESFMNTTIENLTAAATISRDSHRPAQPASPLQQLDPGGRDNSVPRLVTSAELATRTVVLRWIAGELIPVNGVTVVSGNGDAGKTTLLIKLALCISSATPFFGVPVDSGSVLYIDAENGLDAFTVKCQALGIAFDDKLLYCNQHILGVRKIAIEEDTTFDLLKQIIEFHKPAVVIFDSLRRCMAGNIRDDADVDRALGRLDEVCGDSTCIVIHHWRKYSLADNGSGERLSGSADIRNFCRSHIAIETRELAGIRYTTITNEKNNNTCKRIDPIHLRWQPNPDGTLTFVPISDDELCASPMHATAMNILQNEGKAMLRQDLERQCVAQGISKRSFTDVLSDLVQNRKVAFDKVIRNGKSCNQYYLL
jgi:archaellum biogenesis ATPase FlaH